MELPAIDMPLSSSKHSPTNINTYSLLVIPLLSLYILPIYLYYIYTLLTVKETIGVGVNEKAALSSDKNCPFVYINFDFTLVNKVASL